MSRKYKFRDQDKLYFVTFAVVCWVDVFTRRRYKDILVDSLNYCRDHKSLEIYAWCIMSNHVHLIIGRHGQNKMQDILRDLKKYTSYRIITDIKANKSESRRRWMIDIFSKCGRLNCNNTRYQFWQQDNHPIELFNNAIMNQKLDYIHNNPVKAGIVLSAEEYLYSSAKNYCGLESEAMMTVKIIG